MTYTGIINPLDLQSIFVNHFAGTVTLFGIIAIIFVLWYSTKTRMNGILTTMMIVLLLSIISSYYVSLKVMLLIVTVLVVLVSMIPIINKFK